MIAEGSLDHLDGKNVVHTCPHCQNSAVFVAVTQDLKLSPKFITGQRICPECKGHVFVVFEWGRLHRAYPAMRIDFDSTDVPQGIADSFSEALECHASDCHVAAAIMVRRTLEEICADRGAKGKDLKARILDLKNRVVMPQELFDALDELRVLGNDAAHIEAKSFEEIGDEELETAIEFTKEVLKAIYQYKGLLSKLRALKKKSTKAPEPTTTAVTSPAAQETRQP